MKTVVALFEKNNIPMDTIWLDDLYTDAYRYFKWNASSFPDPIEMQKNISAAGKVVVALSDPHIKVESSYPVYAGAQGKYFVKTKTGADYVGMFLCNA